MPQYQEYILYQESFGEMRTNYFKLIFCKLYQWFKYLNVDDIPQYTTLSIYSILISLNILSAFGYGWYFIEGSSLNIFSKGYTLFLFLAVMGLLYLYFIQGRKYIEMYKIYSRSILNNISSSVITIVYILVSILLFISLLWLP